MSQYILKNIPVSDQYIEGSYQYVSEIWRDPNKPNAYKYVNRENKNRNKLQGVTGKKHVFTVSDDKVAGRNAAYLRLFPTNLVRFTFTFQIPDSSSFDLQTSDDYVTIFQMERPFFSANEFRKGNSYAWDTPAKVHVKKDIASSSAAGYDIYYCECVYRELEISGSWPEYQSGKKYPPPSYPTSSDLPAGYRPFHIPTSFYPPPEKTLQTSSLFKQGDTVLVACVFDLQKQTTGRIISIFNTPSDGVDRERDTPADWGSMEMSRYYPNYGLELSPSVAARGNTNIIEIYDPTIGENITKLPDLYTNNFITFASQSFIEDYEYPLPTPEYGLKALDTNILFNWDPTDLTTPSGSEGKGTSKVTTLVSPKGKRYKSPPGGGGTSKLVNAYIVPSFERVRTYNEVEFLFSKDVHSIQIENRNAMTTFYNEIKSITV